MDNTDARQPHKEVYKKLEDVSYTARMYMDDLEHLGAAGVADPSSPLGRLLLYPLHFAAVKGRADIVRFMLGKGYDKDVLHANGETPLRLAAKGGHSATIRALLDAGADATLRCTHHHSALDWAVALGHVDTATSLVEFGADVNAAAIDGNTPLHIASFFGRAETASLLLTKGAAVDALNAVGWTPLFLAADKGRVAATQVLLAAGADASLRKDGVGMSALDKAAREGHADVLRAIIEHGVDVNAPSSRGFTALHTAATCDNAAAVDVLAEAGAKIDQTTGTGLTPLHTAALMSRPEAALALLKRGACVSMRNATGRTPLHYAATKAGKLGTAEVVDLLLRWGADETAIANSGNTPAGIMGSGVNEQDRLAEDVERVRKLLANAPADRAWRRRCFLVLCRAHYPSGRVQLGLGSSHARDTSIAKRTRSQPQPSRAEAEWAGVASMLMGVGADPISLMGDGADIIFETIVGYL